ncbi:MAG: hypothetical protein ACRCZI_12315 [Cetobacterium sp.]
MNKELPFYFSEHRKLERCEREIALCKGFTAYYLKVALSDPQLDMALFNFFGIDPNRLDDERRLLMRRALTNLDRETGKT